MRRTTGLTQWLALTVVIVSAQGCGRTDQAANPGNTSAVAEQTSTAKVEGESQHAQERFQKPEQLGLPAWKQYPECRDEAKRGGQSDSNLRVCIDDASVFIDGPALLRFVTRYGCAEQSARTAMKVSVIPPQLAAALHDIAAKKLQNRKVPADEVPYVKGGVDLYGKYLSRIDQLYPELLESTYTAAQRTPEGVVANHERSKAIRNSISLPDNCKSERPSDITKFAIALTNESLQRFTALAWIREADTIARSNKTVDVDAAKLTIPKFIFSTNSVEIVSRIYAMEAPGNGTYPESMVDLDLLIDNARYTRFAVPSSELPSRASGHVTTQEAALRGQAGKIADAIEKPRNQSASATTIYVPGPESAHVFPPEFFAEHVLWQVAYRELLLNEGIPLDPAAFKSFGLH